MTQTTDVEATSDQERRKAHAIHYNLSYIVQGAGHGTDGAIVLLHDIVAGAFAWNNILPRLAAANRAVYAIDMLGYGLSDHPWPADTSIWGHADGLADPELPKRTRVEDVINDLRATLPNGVQNTKAFEKVLDGYIEPWNSELGKELLFQHIRLLHPNYSNSVSSDLKALGRPALIIWAENDQQIPLKFGQRLHREIAGSRLVTIPDAGHMVLFDAPGAVADAIVDFVEQ